ncbi:mammalian cell entry protein [Thioalkalivibrio denitrificans]|uniref:Mammalian cell entry protein n=1 Tax=Thioalkalivibrio denitrificans TaxID=108003 RepID=A0A1V3N9H0_9GAMM|nr:MlaD family protein [Thioalkalivibrio denitrificans]OOG21446.1 mammalian cell entry protein [Thioalkalivibrio denitrificans]
MKTRSGYFRLGLFIIGAVATGVLLLVVLGVGNLFRPTVMMETYFDGSVQGLDVGAPVKLRGVTIGEVTGIGFTHARYELDVPPVERHQYVMVDATIRVDRLGTGDRVPTPEVVQALVDRGLRVRLSPQGVTGIFFLELDFMDPALRAPIEIRWEPEHIYVPSAPGTVTQFIEYAERVGRRLDALDMEGVVDSMQRVLENLEAMTRALDVARINEETIALLGEFRTSAERLDRVLSAPALAQVPEDLGTAAVNLRALSESPRFDETLDNLDSAVRSVERTARGLETTLQGHEHDFVTILDNLRVMSDQLRALTEDAALYPGVFLGSPPPPRVEDGEGAP